MTTRTDTPMPDDQLPPDPDVDVSDPATTMRPVHLRWRYVGLVAVGGAGGTALRDVISSVLPADGGVSWSIFWINITGALALGVLLEALAHRGPDAGRRRVLRLLLGTGVLGGFTTFSEFSLEAALLYERG